MGIRDSFTINRCALVIVWLGMAAFVVLHSFLLFSWSFEDAAVTSFKIAWFVGLGLVVALSVYFGTRDRSTAGEA